MCAKTMDPIQASRGFGGRRHITLGRFRSDSVKLSFEIPGTREAQSRGMTPFKALLKAKEAGNI